MILVKHKINTLNLNKISNKHGLEVDVRLFNEKFILSHDNNKKTKKIYLSNFIKKFNHRFLILNVKEQHLAEKLLKYMKKKKFKNFFLLDLFVHEIITLKSKKNICARFSFYENLNDIKLIKNFCKWIWVDFLNAKKITQKEFKILKKLGFNICIVSPEVAGFKNIKIIKNFIYYLKKNKIYPHMVCTKKIKLWSKF